MSQQDLSKKVETRFSGLETSQRDTQSTTSDNPPDVNEHTRRFKLETNAPHPHTIGYKSRFANAVLSIVSRNKKRSRIRKPEGDIDCERTEDHRDKAGEKNLTTTNIISLKDSTRQLQLTRPFDKAPESVSESRDQFIYAISETSDHGVLVKGSRKFGSKTFSITGGGFVTDEQGGSNQERLNKGQAETTGETSPTRRNFHSSVDNIKMRGSDIPQSLSNDSGIGSPTDAVCGGHQFDRRNIDKTINEREESDLDHTSTNHLTSDIILDQTQSYFPCNNSQARPVPANLRDDRPILLADASNLSLTFPFARSINHPLVADLEGSSFRLHSSCSDLPNISSMTCLNRPSDQNNDVISNDEIISKETLNLFQTVKNRDLSGSSLMSASNCYPDFQQTWPVRPSNHRRPFISAANNNKVRSVSLSSTVDPLTELTVSNIIKTLIENQNKKLLLGNEDAAQIIEIKSSDGVSCQEKNSHCEVESSTETFTNDSNAPEKPARRKMTFRNVSLQDVIALAESPNSDRKLKGILKSTSVPSLSSGAEGHPDRPLASYGDTRSDLPTPRSVSFNKTHIKNTFSYYNDAFEGEVIREPSKRASLADVVSQIMKHGSTIDMEDDNSHPYGRDVSLTDLITGKRRDHHKMDAGKMIVWLVLAIMIVSLAGGIIFMSETYNMNHKDDNVIITLVETTTLKNQLR